MGDGATKASFAPLVNLLCHLACCLSTETMQNADLESFTVFQDAKDMTKPKTRLEAGQITEEQLMYLTNESLIDLIMRHDYEVETFGNTLAHFSYANKHLTKRICTLALKEISKTDFDRVANYLLILESQLKL